MKGPIKNHVSLGYYNNYTTLVAPTNHIYMVSKDADIFLQPITMKGDHTKRYPRKFCQCHNIGQTSAKL